MSEHKTVIVDIDGTVADLSHRLHFIEGKYGQPKLWDEFYAAVGMDEPIHEMVDLVKLLQHTYDIVFVTGRPERTRDASVAWIKKHIYDDYRVMPVLYMRKDRDYRSDNIVKKELYDRYIKPTHDVAFVLEDRSSVVRMWRAEGLRVLQVAEGDF